MRLNTISAIAVGAFSLLIFFGSVATPAMADDTITVVSLATDLANASTEAEVATLVAAAQTAGLTDTQIADAFGRASVSATNSNVVSTSYASFVANSSVIVATLDSAYSSGQTTASTGGGGNSGGGSGDSFSPPSSGSGGGGGSPN